MNTNSRWFIPSIVFLAMMVIASAGCSGISHSVNNPGNDGSIASETATADSSHQVQCPDGYVQQQQMCTLEIPFLGNTFVTSMQEGADIIEDSFDVLGNDPEDPYGSWKNSEETLSLYFSPAAAGQIVLFVKAGLPKGTTSGSLSFSFKDVTHTVQIDSPEPKVYEVGSWTVDAPGYVKIDIKGSSVTPPNAEFARIHAYYAGGDAMSERPVYVRESDAHTTHWQRRGPHVNLFYRFPEEDVEWFYNEVVVPEGSDVLHTYFMLTGFGLGYMGIQTNERNVRKVLFSVWGESNPADFAAKYDMIPEDLQLVTLRRGQDVLVQPFEGEGAGMQSFYTYPWKAGQTYRALVHVRPTGTGDTDYTGYFGDENGNWHLMASFRRPKHETWYKHAHSFLEVYDERGAPFTREVHYKNQWVRTRAGEWKEITEGKFLKFDGACPEEARMDREVMAVGNEFVIRSNGFFNGKVRDGDLLRHEPSGNPPPEIDFEALEKL